VDIGAATTSVAVYEGGDLQYLAVIPVGSNKITNDLAMVLQIPIVMAEEMKVKHVALGDISTKPVIVKNDKKTDQPFTRSEVTEIVEACVGDDILVRVRQHLKKAGYDRKLPEGVVFVGAGAKLPGLEAYAKTKLELAARVGTPVVTGGVAKEVEKPEYATAVGLMMAMRGAGGGRLRSKGKAFGGIFGFLFPRD